MNRHNKEPSFGYWSSNRALKLFFEDVNKSDLLFKQKCREMPEV